MSLTRKEEKILKSIKVPSENNPNAPEFPPNNPKFPATPTYKIEVTNFENVWLKDESVNLTGTHKDRMAWEMIVTYRQFLLAKKQGLIKQLPKLSILSSGSAALAIQTQLKNYDLPNLNVLMDKNTNFKTVKKLKKIGCKLFFQNLGKTVLNWQDILTLTKNVNGFDITSNEAYDPTIRFYDWMSYEIINSNADYVFVPFGTGQLYENILNIVKRELTYKFKDPRYKGNKKVLQKCSFLGATTNNPKSKADKLYAPFLPFANYSKQWIKYYSYTGIIGNQSNVYSIQETYLGKALDLAEKNKINCEPSGIAGLALLLQMKNKISKNKKILIINTGKTKF
ncbi:MAG: pyridoxal-phosphate dependent enzyme [Candidatus Diapherotrites archaeon]|nr:pyridoxal-phosphate dependent enzyme [Candidatus Diapherotrites archaeon]